MTDQLPQKSLTSPIPANETERLSALHRYKILDTPPEVAFDRITTLAARLFKMPIALISLVDESRAWFKSSIGFNSREVPRDATLCSFAVLADEPLIIPDTRLDKRFACNPFVQSEPGVRFYAGAPLLSHDGFNLGTLCLLDTQPHEPLTPEQQATLVDLAAMVVDELELRLAAQKIAQVDVALLEITQGVSTVTGGAFLDALVQHFAKVLDTDYVYIGLIEGDDPKQLRTIATFAQGQIVDNLTYALQDTPCWEVIGQRKICCYPRNVQAHFPNAPLLKPLSVESYIAAPFYDSNGTPLGILGVMDGKPMENVHLAESLLTIFANRIATELERQQAEAALLESEAQFRLLANTVPQLIWTAQADGGVDYLNEQWLEYTGIPPQVFYEWGWQQIIHPDDLPCTLELWTAALKTGDPFEIKHRFRHVTGEWRWQLVRGVSFRNESGQIIKWFGTCTDIHESVMREQDAKFLSDLSEAIRTSNNPDELMTTTAEMIGQYLQVKRCCFAETDEAHDRWWVNSDYHSSLPSMVGEYRVSDYPPVVVERLRSGHLYISYDNQIDPRTVDYYATAYAPLGIRAHIVVPFYSDGRWTVILNPVMLNYFKLEKSIPKKSYAKTSLFSQPL